MLVAVDRISQNHVTLLEATVAEQAVVASNLKGPAEA